MDGAIAKMLWLPPIFLGIILLVKHNLVKSVNTIKKIFNRRFL